jgi:acetyl esterase/lipase
MDGKYFDRRAALMLAGTVMLSTPARAQAPMPALPSLDTDLLPSSREIVPLWPGKAPGDRGTSRTLIMTERSPEPGRYHDRAATGVTTPTLTVYRPAKPNGAAILIMPGGAFTHITSDKEGADVARALNKAGITGFVLLYRLPAEGWDNPRDVPLQDAQRAMRLIRANAKDFAIDPKRVGVMGFSAGGALASAMATVGPDMKAYEPVDASDAIDCRPDFAGLIYAGVLASGRNIRPQLSDAEYQARSPLYNVNTAVPPCFLCQNVDDPEVPVANIVAFFEACHKAGVPAALHLFEKGGHGFGIRGAAGTPTSAWTTLFIDWAISHGFVKSA